jgi:hypothetical protein
MHRKALDLDLKLSLLYRSDLNTLCNFRSTTSTAHSVSSVASTNAYLSSLPVKSFSLNEYARRSATLRKESIHGDLDVIAVMAGLVVIVDVT